MKVTLLIKKLNLSREKFITADVLKKYCSMLKLKYLPVIKYLLREQYVVRILKGIFYVKSVEERKLNYTAINHYEALKEALKLKKVGHWYFGLESALKINNVTHEYFTMDFLMTDSLYRPKPVTIMNHKVKFIKLHKSLFSFGIIKEDIHYADIEKTILDMIYLDKRHGVHNEAIKKKVNEFIRHCSRNRIKKYATHYPGSVRALVEELL